MCLDATGSADLVTLADDYISCVERTAYFTGGTFADMMRDAVAKGS